MKNKLLNSVLFIFEFYKLAVFILTGIFFFAVILAFLQFYLFPDFIFIGKTIVSATNKELSLLLTSSFILLSIVVGIELWQKKMPVIKLFNLSKEELLVYIITSFLCSYFLTTSFQTLSKLSRASILILTVCLFLFLPYVVEFYISYNLDYFKKLIRNILNEVFEFFQLGKLLVNENYKKQLRLNAIRSHRFVFMFRFWLTFTINKLKDMFLALLRADKKKLTRFIIYVSIRLTGLIITVLLMLLIIFRIIESVDKYLNYQRSLRQNLTIMKVVPIKTTLAERVIINGFNFGWKLVRQDKLMSTYGPVIVESWTDKLITFVVPLHWKEGQVDLWVEKLKDTTKNAPLIKSNKVRVQIMSRWYYYPEEKAFQSEPFLNYWEKIVKKIRRELYLRGIY